jgi:hypothetical protein
MSFPIRQAHERLERNQKLAQDLLISGLLPIVGVLISASYIGFYTVPILIVILTYLYKVINILLDKEENIFLRLVKNIEETEKALNYFKKFCIPIITFSMISNYYITYPTIQIPQTLTIQTETITPIKTLTLGETIALTASLLSQAYLHKEKIKLHLKKTLFQTKTTLQTHTTYHLHKTKTNLTKISENIKPRNKQ